MRNFPLAHKLIQSLLWALRGDDFEDTTIQRNSLRLNSEECKGKSMKRPKAYHNQSGKIGWILLWLLGIPIPVLIVIFLLRGCT
jgi:hypothetical protein